MTTFVDFTLERLFLEPSQSYFLFGPRGTGKSTMVMHRHPKALVINLLLPELRRRYLANPQYLLELVRAEPNGQTIIVDEIQKVPELLSLIHVLIEEKKQWQFILTGSSARKLKQQGVDLLGGRALRKSLHPFMAVELKDAFNFLDALQYGLLPLRFTSADPIAMLSSYVMLYLEEEVKAEGMIRQIEPFARFLEVLSFSHGGVLNVSNIARECSVKRSTADVWLSIVEDLLILYRIPVFNRRAKRILTTQSKIYFFDVGVYRALRPAFLLDKATEIEGAALEGLVAQHLRAWIDYTEKPHGLYYWRTKSGLEVDFIIYGEWGLWAIEVKNNQQVSSQDLRGLKNFKEDYPAAELILLYRGVDKLFKEEVRCLPCEGFIRDMMPNQPLV